MNNKFPSKLLLESGRGNFKLVNSIIMSEMLELDNKTAAKIIIECCRILYKNPVPTVEEKELYQLLITCKLFIKNLNDDIFLSCLQSLYFIVKFFLMQKKFELVLGIKSLLLPQYGDCLKNVKLTTSYTSLCSLIHNAVVDLQLAETSQTNSRVFCQMCTLSLQMKSICVSTNVLLAKTARYYFNLPIFFEADTDSQYNCYLVVLQLLKTSTETETGSSFSDVDSAAIRILDIVIRNLFKQNEFSKIREFIEITTLTVEKLSNTKISLQLFSILYQFRHVLVKLEDVRGSSTFLTSNFETCLKDLKSFSDNYRSTECEKLFNLLYLIFFNLLEYYANISPAIWNTCMDENFQIGMCKLLGCSGQIISQIKRECHNCSNCGVTNNLYSAVLFSALAGNLLKISLNKQESVSKSMCSYVLYYLENCCIFIKKLHSQECSQWKSALAQGGVMIYNIAVKLYSIKHDECYNYFELLIKNFIHLEGSAISSVFKCDVLGTSLECLSERNIDSRRFRKALMYAAIRVLISSEPIKAYNMWVRAKSKSKDGGVEEDHCLQELTVVCVLQQNENEIKHLYPDINLELDAAVTKNLLMGELAQYKMMWQSKIPMLAAFRKLCDVADLLTLVKIIIQTWHDSVDSAHCDVIKLLNKITFKFKFEIENNIKTKESCQKTEEQLYLASLYAIQYYAETKIVRQKIVDDINNTAIPEQFPLPPHEMPKNPNDEYDLVSSYLSLKLDEHLKIIELLSTALTLLSTCVSDCTSPIIITMLKHQNMFNFVVKIAHEFRLHRNLLQTIQAWFVCLKISRLVNNNLYILQSISFLLEETNMDSEVINELLTEAEKLKNDLTKNASPEIWAVLTTYHINKSRMLLRHQNIQAGFKEYEQAVECFLKTEEDGEELLKIRLDFLHIQYLQLPCDIQIDGHNVFSLAKCSKVLNKITSYLKVSDNSSLAVATLFEVYQAVVHMYRWMCLPREVRCYCRVIVTFAQQLVLPFQTASFLSHLAHADLLSTRLDDCQVKLNGLSNILCLDNKRNNSSYNEEVNENIAITSKDIHVSNLVESFAEIMLDCPVTNYKYEGSSGSPVLFVKPFMLPSFTKHSVDCDCFYCVSVEYKTLVLEYFNLEAQLHILRGNTEVAQTYFTGGLQLYRNIGKDATFKTKITKYLACYPLRDLKDIFCQTVCALLLNYANSLLRTNDIKRAELFNQKILNLISIKKHENFYMYNEALLQKYAIVVSMYKENYEGIQNCLQVNTKLFTSKDINEMPKTPENKQTKIVITTCYSPRPNSPPKRRLRKIKCDFLDTNSENSDNLKMTTPSFSADGSPEGKATDHLKFDLLDEMKNTEDSKGSIKITSQTPSPCSKTYIPPTIKTVKKDKPILQDIHTPLTYNTVINDTNANDCVKQNISSIIPSSPNSYTPNARQVSSALRSRTKLLTKRLKKSAVEKVLINNLENNTHGKDSASSNSKIDNKQVKDNICKNLMSELCAAETNVCKKRFNKKKTGECVPGADCTEEGTERVNTRRTTRANSKIV